MLLCSRMEPGIMPLKDDHINVRCTSPEKFSGRGPIWGSSCCNDDMCEIDDKDDLVVGESIKFDSASLSDDINKVCIIFIYALQNV